MGCTPCPLPHCMQWGSCDPEGGGGGIPAEQEWGNSKAKLAGQLPKPRAGACRAPGSCSPPRGSLPPTAWQVPAVSPRQWLYPITQPHHWHGGVPPCMGTPCLGGGVQRQVSS